jgi:hypothetical protein
MSWTVEIPSQGSFFPMFSRSANLPEETRTLWVRGFADNLHHVSSGSRKPIERKQISENQTGKDVTLVTLVCGLRPVERKALAAVAKQR